MINDETAMNSLPATISNVLILTGSGISADSGLSTFRDEGGLWAKHRIEDVATPEAFERNPALVQSFYNTRRAELKSAEPNDAHHALAKLEDQLDATVTVITQNVDDLHERAGSRNLLHMHGELAKARCLSCHQIIDWSQDIQDTDRCAHCKDGGLRPHIVWFGEIPLYLDEIDAAIANADLFISIGTSGAVYPAAGLVSVARALGVYTVELNLEKSDGHHFFHEGRYGRASEVVPAFVDALLDR